MFSGGLCDKYFGDRDIVNREGYVSLPRTDSTSLSDCSSAVEVSPPLVLDPGFAEEADDSSESDVVLCLKEFQRKKGSSARTLNELDLLEPNGCNS